MIPKLSFLEQSMLVHPSANHIQIGAKKFIIFDLLKIIERELS